MRFVAADEVDALLDFEALIEALGQIFGNRVEAPPRHHHTKHNAQTADQTVLLMPAWDENIIITKLVCVTPDNGTRALPAVMASVFVQDAKTGAPLAVIDGARLTLWRTAAASALAARYLAPQSAKTLLVVGAGALSPFMVKAHMCVRSYETVLIWNRTHEKAMRAATVLQKQGIAANAVATLDRHIPDADVISTVTLSTQPLIKGHLLSPQTHLDLVGAFTPRMRETDDDCVQLASIFVDTFAGALSEGGDLVQPINAGIMTAKAVKADLADLVTGRHSGRSRQEEITLFKSTGASIEDLAAATLICQRAGLI